MSPEEAGTGKPVSASLYPSLLDRQPLPRAGAGQRESRRATVTDLLIDFCKFLRADRCDHRFRRPLDRN